ncbi:hypothetical protein BJV82DRAFT_509457, partial [Fennellomyces sp. T-0311]
LNFSIEEAVDKASQSGSFLAEMLQMLEPKQVKMNETIRDAYNECVKLKEYMSEKLWAVSDNDGIASLQASVESLQSVCQQYEQIKDADEVGDW